MTGEINLHSVLFECMQIMREELDICSKKYNGLEPKEGMEEAWTQARIKVQILQNMLHALDNEEVRAALGKWELTVKAKGEWQYETETEEKEPAEKDKRPEPEAGANVKGHWHAG